MKDYYRFHQTIFCIGALLLISCTQQNQSQKQLSTTVQNHDGYQDYLYQYSIIDALLAGVYDGNLTIGELKSKGTLGIGAFNKLDGELYMNQGTVHKIRYDGSVHLVPDEEKTPAAFVKKFEPDTVVTITQKGISYEQFQKQLRNLLNINDIYAIRLFGSFSSMDARAPAPARKPYPPLAEYLNDHQHEFDLASTSGTAVGFYLPDYVNRMNVPGFHFHYLSEDKRAGGHVLDFTADSLTIEIDKARGIILENMDSEAFRRANLQKDREEELQSVE